MNIAKKTTRGAVRRLTPRQERFVCEILQGRTRSDAIVMRIATTSAHMMFPYGLAVQQKVRLFGEHSKRQKPGISAR
jgi:hypothetical protein